MQKLVIGGIYKHYKGALVRVLGVVRHSETCEEMIHYLHLDDGKAWVRPKEMFLEDVTKDGKTFPRFKLVEERPEENLDRK